MLRREDALEPQRAPTDTAHCMGDRRVELAVSVLPVARVLGAHEALEERDAAVDVAHLMPAMARIPSMAHCGMPALSCRSTQCWSDRLARSSSPSARTSACSSGE